MELGKASIMSRVSIFLLLAAVGCLPVHAGVILNIGNEGTVVGASGIDVGGSSFDVEFLDGTCASVWGLCAPSSFTFSTESAALAASQALIDQVFSDDVFSDDAVAQSLNPIIEGCGNRGICGIYTPFSTMNSFMQLAFATTQGQPGFVDFTGTGRYRIPDPTALNFTYARWSPSTAVPTPGVLPLLAVGIAALAWFPRQRVRLGRNYTPPNKSIQA